MCLPSGSLCSDYKVNLHCLEIKMPTPLVLLSALANEKEGKLECIKDGQNLFGKCVSCKRITSTFWVCIYWKTLRLLIGVFSPCTLCEAILRGIFTGGLLAIEQRRGTIWVPISTYHHASMVSKTDHRPGWDFGGHWRVLGVFPPSRLL